MSPGRYGALGSDNPRREDSPLRVPSRASASSLLGQHPALRGSQERRRTAGEIRDPDGRFKINLRDQRILMGSATAPKSGVGIFIGKDGADYEARFGDPGGQYLHWDGSTLLFTGDLLGVDGTFVGTLSGVDGFIGGWEIFPGELRSGNVRLQSSNERLLLGAATAPLTGVGVFIGLDGSDYELRVGDPSGHYLHWNGATLVFTGNLQGASGTFSGDLSAAGGTFTGTLQGVDGDFSGTVEASAIIASESFTASQPVFDGVVDVEAGEGGRRVQISAPAGGGGAVFFFDDSAIQQGFAGYSSSTDELRVNSAPGVAIDIDAGDNVLLDADGDILGTTDGTGVLRVRGTGVTELRGESTTIAADATGGDVTIAADNDVRLNPSKTGGGGDVVFQTAFDSGKSGLDEYMRIKLGTATRWIKLYN